MKKKKYSWEQTREFYISWLSKTKLRYVFSKKLHYENLSLWWLTKVYEKDALNDHTWFNELNNIQIDMDSIEIKKRIRATLYKNFRPKISLKNFNFELKEEKK